MNLLAIETSTDRAALALTTADGRCHVAHVESSGRHGRDLLPALRDLLNGSGLRATDLDALAVGLGPGSYTGLRIGVMAAKTLAYAAGCPLTGLDSLEVLACNAPADVLHVVVIGDAQRGDLYVAEFSRDEPGATLRQAKATRIEPASYLLGLDGGTLVIGPGLRKLASPLPDGLVAGSPEQARPEGERLAELALRVYESGRRDDPWSLEPIYLRRSAAEDQWARRQDAPPALT
ncbi:tRNA (adenosine(37)-N6)-threonylcarbamoyltransferase complex dimerization subunit type 1 TsaB [Isosphaeraceae bacterium EP7]